MSSATLSGDTVDTSTQTINPNTSNTNAATFLTTLKPLPVPRSVGSPNFDGHYVHDFILTIERIGTNAGLATFELPSIVLQYCSDDVKKVIRYADELQGISWPNTKLLLIGLYESNDEPPRATMNQLRDFIRKSSTQKDFTRRFEFDEYHRGFLAIASQLKNDGLLTDTELRVKFFYGLPVGIQIIAVVCRLFDPNSLLAHREDPEEDEYAEPPKPLIIAANQQLEPTTLNVSPPRQTTAAKPKSEVELLTDQLSQLTISMQQLQAQQAQMASNTSRPPMDRNGRCFICGLTGTHVLHPRHCPEMNRLIQDGLAAFNVEQNKYTLPDGSGLPTLPFSAGGVAKYLREHHTNVNQTTTTASASSVSLVFDSNMALGGNLIGITADEYNDYVRPAKDKGKEKEKDKSVHFDPKPPTAPSSSVPQVPLQPVPVRPTPSTSKAPIVPAPPDIPRPTNPLNTRDGWKDAKGQKNPAREDVTMKDATSKTKDQGKYYLTSDLQESISLERVEKHILDQVVSLPLRDILGISSGLQRRLQEATKTRREYYTSAGEYDLVTEEAEKYLAQSNTATYATTTKRLYCPEQDEFFTFLVRFTNAVSLNQTRLLAMTTGVFKGKLYGQTIRFMVDTGSELNLIPDRLLSIPGLALDYEGQKWSLKGINGPSIGLRGVCLGAEITIGAHRFDHHLFVSGENMTSQDCILGQPWAHWFAARIDFDRSGEMAMEIWKNGDRSEPPTLRLQLTIPDDPKNVTTFDHRTHRRETASNNTLQAAQVEDVTDSECEEDDFEKDFQ
ncbi:hypothetical protein BDQ17DRAFT_1437061 [Cyathus striatus]|nr:hypothetical protein BDQ17DRAFT_1437061 [Cyathus striatus]